MAKHIQKKEHLVTASRKFYEIDLVGETKDLQVFDNSNSGKTSCHKRELLRFIDDNVIGKDKVFSGPYGLRSVVYCDYVASGKSLSFIEDYIRDQVLPEYGNTHTTTTVTSLQTTLFRHEARDIIRNSVNASEHDAVLFVGSGCTGAVHKLIHALNFTKDPVVFVSPYEHHSTLLPWREIAHAIIEIGLNDDGSIDLKHLEQQLKTWQGSGRDMIGCFSAASNITGYLVDVDHITVLLHKNGALAIWDYASAGPYVKIDMNPVVASEDQPFIYKDAIFISPHKFVGGVATPGILIAKKKLFRHPVPSTSGGGSVFFVRGESHRYLQDIEMREEGGTPAIVESIRAGLVFQLKEAITPELIMSREHQYCRKAMEYWKDVDNFVLLGNKTHTRLPTFSFLIRHPETGLFLHHNFVCALLNDMFGIQARGGCACAGPYAEYLLGIDEELAEFIERLLVEDSKLDRTHLRRKLEYSHREILRPGFVRLSFMYFMNEKDIDFVLEAVKIIAEEGWKMLPQYIFNPETGEWRHRKHQVFKDRKWLGHISYVSGKMSFRDPPKNKKGPLPQSHQECITLAKEILTKAEKVKVKVGDQVQLFDELGQRIRWFLLPSEALHWLNDKDAASTHLPKLLPFYPGKRIIKRQMSETCGSMIDDSLNLVKNLALSEAISDDDDSTTAKVSTTDSQQASDTKVDEVFEKGMTFALSRGFITGKYVSVFSKKNTSGMNTLQENINICTEGVNAVKSSQDESLILPKNLKTGNPNESKSENSIENNSKENNSSSPCGDSAYDSSGDSNASHCYNRKQECQTKTICDTGGGALEASESCSSERESCSLFLRPRKDNVSNNICSVEAENVKWHAPPSKKIFKPTLQALEDYDMIKDGDKVLVCLSGGKDSLSLLHTMRQYQFYAKSKGINFQFGAVTVDPKTAAYYPRPLKPYLEALGVPYLYEEQAILEQAANLPYDVTSICSFCSRMKRGRLYAAARREGYNVLAMGQHLDDLAESFLMNAFHNGNLQTMKAHYTIKEGDLRVIRPFAYVREIDLRKFAEGNKLPIIPENCPACFESPKERNRTKQVLASQEVLFPELFYSLLTCIKPLLGLPCGMTVAMAVNNIRTNKTNAEFVVNDEDI